MYTKKDKKKAEKQKKKEEKEKKLREEKERQEKLLEQMKGTRKEKKQKPKKEKKQKAETVQEKPPPTPEVTTAPSLFQTLSQKIEPEKDSVAAAFMPFTATEEPEAQETSKLRIIPNVSNIESSTPQPQSIQEQQTKQARKEILICKQCGAILSSDYQFCNKCGSQL